MIKVLKEGKVPREQIKCNNCGSLLEYGNADLAKDYEAEKDAWTVYDKALMYRYYFVCPVCSCKISASWIINKEEKK